MQPDPKPGPTPPPGRPATRRRWPSPFVTIPTALITASLCYGALQFESVRRRVLPRPFVEQRSAPDFELRRLVLGRRDAARAAGDAAGAARVHAMLSREAMLRARAVHDAWMAHRDPKTALFRHEPSRPYWTYADIGADFFGHQLNVALLTDAPTVPLLLATIDAERALAPPGALSTRGDARTGAPIEQSRRLKIFGTTEYIKDGLMPVLERHAHPAVRTRILEVVGAILANSDHPSRFGPIPDTRSEVNGQMLQILSRLHFATGDEQYADAAARIADAAIGQMLPANHGLPVKEYDYDRDRIVRGHVQIRDHGNEMLVGLSEVYALAVHRSGESAWGARADRWAEPITRMYELVLAHGRNGQGLLVNQLDAERMEPLNAGASDNWGYVLCGAELFVQAAERRGGGGGAIDPARAAALREKIGATVESVLRTNGHPWEGTHQDGYSDSLESAIYAAAYGWGGGGGGVDAERIGSWVDGQIAVLFHKQRSSGFVDDHYLDGNFMRTSLLYAQLRSGGWTAHPWSPSVGVGFERADDRRAVLVVTAGAEGFRGSVVPDTRRHDTVLRLPWNWPRLNSWPEWNTVDQVGRVAVLEGGEHVTVPSLAALADGIAVELPPHASVVIELELRAVE
ncbi:MAG: hypothetical protein ACKVU4_11795 [Phycisphaerales bacterium]